MPNRSEVIERLRGVAQDMADTAGLAEGRDTETEIAASRHAILLTQAADLLEAGEGRVEYRVAHLMRDRDGMWEKPLADPTSLEEAKRRLDVVRRGARSPEFGHRIQSRTVHETEWIDLEEGEQ